VRDSVRESRGWALMNQAAREGAPDDRLRGAIHLAARRKNALLRRFAPRNDGISIQFSTAKAEIGFNV
jgi:hypothetical protein